MLERAEEAFDDGDAAGLADSAEAGLDLLPAAPISETPGGELRALIGDEDCWFRAARADNASEELTNVARCRLFLEDGCAEAAAGVMVDHGSNPITPRPALRHGLREPRNPKSGEAGRGGEIALPNFVGGLGAK